MDIRRTPGEHEKNLLKWFTHLNLEKILVLTKSDKLSKNKQTEQKSLYAKSLFVDKNELFLFSAKNLQGKEDILTKLETIISDASQKVRS
jgi:GTP-binding protein